MRKRHGSFWISLLSILLISAACAPAPTAHISEPLGGSWNVAILPLANYSQSREAPTRLMPVMAIEFRSRLGYRVIDPGRVEEALADEPWILSDRIPPDLADALGHRLNADALILGSVLAYGFRTEGGLEIPIVSLSLRMIEVPGGALLWSAVHTRDGSDRESVFGLGRNANISKLSVETVREMLNALPAVAEPSKVGVRLPPAKGSTP